MAKKVLPTNFMDDILNESMNGKRRWTITRNDDGTYTLEDATTYDQLGNTFGQAQVNEMNKAINESVDQARVIDDYKTLAAVNQEGFVSGAKPVAQLIRDLGGMQFGTDGDGNCGYYGADGSLIPFNRMTDYTFYVAAQGYGGGLTFPRSFLDAAGFTKADIHSSKGMHAFNTATTHKNHILYSVHDEIGVDISSNGKFTEGFSVFQLGDGGTGGSWGTVRLYK